jgi:hypothetical protein
MKDAETLLLSRVPPLTLWNRKMTTIDEQCEAKIPEVKERCHHEHAK